MKIIYHCFGGSHSSVTAAAIHLGLLSTDRLPTAEELMKVPYFDKTPGEIYGVIRYMGQTQDGHQVYVLGKKNLGRRMNRIFIGLAELLGMEREIVVTNTMPYVNVLMMLGGYLSRRWGLTFPGRAILIWGTRLAFPALADLVRQTRLKTIPGGGRK